MQPDFLKSSPFALIEKIKSEGATLYSLSTYRNGEANHYPVTPSDNCHNSYSVAKAFTVTAIGMLVDENKLSTDDLVVDILGKYLPVDADPLWKSVRVHDLLTHTFGISRGFLDIDAEDPLKFGDDYLAYCFKTPLYKDLLHTRTYSDGAYYMLSRIVAEISGTDLRAYLTPRLFIPLKFKEVAWSTCPMGYSMGATGLYIRTDDMLKLGVVYLEGGTYQGKRILSNEWVKTVFERGYELRPRASNPGVYAKGGMYGQMLYISRNENTVLAWHAHDRCGAVKRALEYFNM